VVKENMVPLLKQKLEDVRHAHCLTPLRVILTQYPAPQREPSTR
jgi:hypothetical protein